MKIVLALVSLLVIAGPLFVSAVSERKIAKRNWSSEVPQPDIVPYNAQQSSEIPSTDGVDDVVRCDVDQVDECIDAYNQYCGSPSTDQICNPCYSNLMKCFVDANCDGDPFFETYRDSCLLECSEFVCNNAINLAFPSFLCLTLALLSIFV